MYKWIMSSGTILLLLSVVFGAFAAHGLKSQISEHSLSIFQTGVHYQAIHGIGLILCGLFALLLSNRTDKTFTWIKLTAVLFCVGVLCFSASLYTLALTDITWVGPITPIGGLLLILGWLCFTVAIIKS